MKILPERLPWHHKRLAKGALKLLYTLHAEGNFKPTAIHEALELPAAVLGAPQASGSCSWCTSFGGLDLRRLQHA